MFVENFFRIFQYNILHFIKIFSFSSGNVSNVKNLDFDVYSIVVDFFTRIFSQLEMSTFGISFTVSPYCDTIVVSSSFFSLLFSCFSVPLNFQLFIEGIPEVSSRVSV